MRQKLLGIFLYVTVIGFLFFSGCQSSVEKEDNNILDEHENASAIAIDNGEGQINVTLIGIGENYGSGYTDFNVLIEGENVLNLPTKFTLGESFFIGKNDEGYYVNADRLPADTYNVKIVVLNTIIFDDNVFIT